MKTSSSLQLAAAGLLSLASVALGVPYCAITCFQDVITDHPPLSCTEANMYLCFCKAEDLQGYFLDCVYSECGADADEAVDFGVDLCQELGVPITVPPRPTPSAPSTDAPSTPSATNNPPASEPTSKSTGAPKPPTSSSKPSGGDSTNSPPAEPTASGEPTDTSVPEPTAGESGPSGYPTASASSGGYANSTSTDSGSASGSASASPTVVTVNMGSAKDASAGLLAAAGIAMVAFQLL
ncbi:hypothetical protein QBC33DRAFT_596104 [Phialemonium atrogriseum]|uniref:CFEM domain-containing protein n=1 Tax=Phialemonium atrogriseum TaxID=1093897 RepID=A0AAJ0BTH5_9PEZI|nr:uncharacterized protein QBC33DRAFT_596104 [Phialemonium atrogriseum]KAK1764180.1 hypothetical protein QBC33DRAFT_596104 [Phialemonium atrogriseum]